MLGRNESIWSIFFDFLLINFFFWGGGGQNVCQNGNFCIYFENSRKGPICKASDES